jgi:glycosyltransferase involved in cell wall biosynthesis
LHVLSDDPLVGVACSGAPLTPAAHKLLELANGAVAHLWIRPNWHGPAIAKDLAAFVREVGRATPNLQAMVMAATYEDRALFHRLGVDAIWCNPNALIDERAYAPDLDAEKRYDAVNVGRLVPFKRHELAAKVPRLALVTHGFEVEATYAEDCLSTLEGLSFVNYEPGREVQPLKPDAVRALLVQSRCGLALSAVEGAMYASTEYLLCGLPVVTTPSQGGRHVFFHPDYVETVEPTADAVARGVARIIAKAADPLAIRRRTLQLMRPHRARLIGRLSAVVEQDLMAQASETLWLPSFVDKLEHWVAD